MTPNEAARRLVERLHAREARAWQLVRALKVMDSMGSRSARFAVARLKAAERQRKAHYGMRSFPSTFRRPTTIGAWRMMDDGSPRMGGYSFPSVNTAGVSFNPASRTGMMALTPQAVSALRGAMDRAASSQNPASFSPTQRAMSRYSGRWNS